MLGALSGILLVILIVGLLTGMFRGGIGLPLILLGLIICPVLTIVLILFGLAILALPLIILVGVIALIVKAVL